MAVPSKDSGVHVWLVLMKAYRSLGRHAARTLEGFDLGVSDFAVLELILHKGPQNVNEIGRRVELTSGSITSAVDRLETRGLVVRRPHPTDRRGRVVHLTPQGTAEITRIFALHRTAMNDAASGLTKAERGALADLLKKLGTSADERLARDDVGG